MSMFPTLFTSKAFIWKHCDVCCDTIKFCKRDDNKECHIFFEDPLVMYFKNSMKVIFFFTHFDR